VRDTKICAWDIEEDVQRPYFQDRKALADYCQACDGKPRDIVKKIRPVLETHCRNLYPEDFGEDELGTIIGKIRKAGPAHRFYPILEDLDMLNDYTRRYHHGENPKADTEPIDGTELYGFAQKSLTIIGCC
jgi:hypothetical protein